MTSKGYHGNPDYKKRVTASNKLKRQQMLKNREVFDIVMQQFLAKVKNGPVFVCSCCERLLFESQALHCKKEKYKNQELANKCIRDRYLHTCTDDCKVPCVWIDIGRGQSWICSNCDNKLKRGVLPPECVLNNLAGDPIPPELACLNSIEQHLIAKNIPFMKMVALPKGGQNGVHGPDTCVPANIVRNYKFAPPLKDGRFYLTNKVKA